jgi:hypothetical protein
MGSSCALLRLELLIPFIQFLEQIRGASTGHVLEGHRIERRETLTLECRVG